VEDLCKMSKILRCDSFRVMFCIIRMKFIAVKKLRQENSVVASGGWMVGCRWVQRGVVLYPPQQEFED